MNASLLVHEATDTWIPVEVDRYYRGNKKTPELVTEKTVAKGHSTAKMAGTFAKSINAQQLVLNHFSAKYVCFLECFKGYHNHYWADSHMLPTDESNKSCPRSSNRLATPGAGGVP